MRDCTVVGVGARGWERFGLWPSLARACDLRLFSDGLGDDEPFTCATTAARRERCQRILRFVEQQEPRPHLVFLYANTTNFDAGLFQALADQGIWTVLMGLDDKHTFLRYRVGELLAGVELVAPFADLYWTSWRTGLLLHHAIGSRAWLGGIAADPRFHRPLGGPRDLGVLFLGAAYGVRRELVSALQRRGLPVVARGHGWPGAYVTFDGAVQLISRAQIVLGISSVGAMDDVTILKGRDFEVPMCGACYVTQHVEELGDYFEVGRDLVCYSNERQAAEALHGLLRDPERQEQMRVRALRRSLEQHTWERRLAELYRFLRGPGVPTGRSTDDARAS
jgi:hypothetical protein